VQWQRFLVVAQGQVPPLHPPRLQSRLVNLDLRPPLGVVRQPPWAALPMPQLLAEVSAVASLIVTCLLLHRVLRELFTTDDQAPLCKHPPSLTSKKEEA
jgi:hypothetical protein